MSSSTGLFYRDDKHSIRIVSRRDARDIQRIYFGIIVFIRDVSSNYSTYFFGLDFYPVHGLLVHF